MRILRFQKTNARFKLFYVEANFIDCATNMAQMFEHKIVRRVAHSGILCHIQVYLK